MPTNHHVVVDAKIGNWTAGFPLDPNSTWLILPSSASRYSLNGGTTHETFQGSSDMDGTKLHIPATVRLGGLAILVWHGQSDGSSVPEIVTFPPGRTFASVTVGPKAGSMFFMICDLPGAYGDNSGVCEVDVNTIDGPHLSLFQGMCDSYQKVNDDGAFAKLMLKCGIQIVVTAVAAVGGAVVGGPPGAEIFGGAALVTSDACADTLHQVVIGTQDLINQIRQQAADDQQAEEEERAEQEENEEEEREEAERAAEEEEREEEHDIDE